MVSMKSWMLGAAVAAGTLGLAAVPAQAAEFSIYVHGPAAYVPPCPGPGYVWFAGYYADGYWVPGHWEFVGGPERYERGVYFGFGHDHYRPVGPERGQDFDRGDRWGHDRGGDRGRDMDRGYGHDRDGGWDRGRR